MMLVGKVKSGELKALAVLDDDGAVRSILEAPVKCGGCERMTCFVVNRNGRTTCLDCDAEKQAPAAP